MLTCIMLKIFMFFHRDPLKTKKAKKERKRENLVKKAQLMYIRKMPNDDGENICVKTDFTAIHVNFLKTALVLSRVAKCNFLLVIAAVNDFFA